MSASGADAEVGDRPCGRRRRPARAAARRRRAPRRASHTAPAGTSSATPPAGRPDGDGDELLAVEHRLEGVDGGRRADRGQQPGGDLRLDHRRRRGGPAHLLGHQGEVEQRGAPAARAPRPRPSSRRRCRAASRHSAGSKPPGSAARTCSGDDALASRLANEATSSRCSSLRAEVHGPQCIGSPRHLEVSGLRARN